MKSTNSIFQTGLFRVLIAPCLFLFVAISVEASDRQRHKYVDPWILEQRRRERKQEEQAQKAATEAAKKAKEQQMLEDNRRWEAKRAELQSRFNAIDVNLTLERAKSEFVSLTNRFAKSPTPAFVAHTNNMVKLTKQFLGAQEQAKSCFNPNAVLTHVETNIFRYEKAHEALVREMDSFNQSLVSGDGEEEGENVGGTRTEFDRPVFSRRRTRTVLVSPNTMDIPKVAPSPPLPADKLRELKKLFDEGILSKEEYDTKRKELLDTL